MGWFDSKSTGEIIERSLNYQDELGWRMHWMMHWSTSIVISIATKVFFILGQAPINVVMFVLIYFIMGYVNKRFANFDHKIHQISQQEG